ncbi:hypothetical protein V6N11_034842 [Hibiscus sabdariffa]|uniref:Uncharacterized protein n=1 Tax=Hibiscus sabdariffa TaxID=183260 RepID=A0ABR1ZIN2_9ROSI
MEIKLEPDCQQLLTAIYYRRNTCQQLCLESPGHQEPLHEDQLSETLNTRLYVEMSPLLLVAGGPYGDHIAQRLSGSCCQFVAAAAAKQSTMVHGIYPYRVIHQITENTVQEFALPLV